MGPTIIFLPAASCDATCLEGLAALPEWAQWSVMGFIGLLLAIAMGMLIWLAVELVLSR